MQSTASHPICRQEAFGVMIPKTSAEIPPADAPLGFDETPQAFALK